MKQKQYAPMSTAEMGLSIFAANEGFLDDVEVNKIGDFEATLLSYANSEFADLMAQINVKGDFSKDISAGLKELLEKFKATQAW
jgi:F-type H+-transporting ATPase subunit alpha